MIFAYFYTQKEHMPSKIVRKTITNHKNKKDFYQKRANGRFLKRGL